MPRRSLEGPKKAPDLVPRNSRGGVLVTDEELKSAFEFFDVEGSGKITQAQLKKRLGVFYKDMPNKEYKFLMNDQSELTLDDLRELLLDNEVKNFDPVAEAFKALIPASRGVEAPSRHRRDSFPSSDEVGGFFFEFEAIRTASSDRDAPRRSTILKGRGSSTRPC